VRFWDGGVREWKWGWSGAGDLHEGYNGIAVDYEFRIKLLETETAHLKEMQHLLGAHQDITDERMDKMGSIASGLLESMVELRNAVMQTTVDVAKLAKKVDDLVDALLKEPRNGKGTL
jgi:hypothetical protein